MTISVKIDNPNAPGKVSSIEIFRSTSKAQLYDASNKLTTVAPDTTVYDDAAAVVDVLYYYGVRLILTNGSIDSPAIPSIKKRSLSIGSPTILHGTPELGYMGTVNELMSEMEGATVAAILAASLTTATSPSSLYSPFALSDLAVEKMMVNGNIIFIPTFPVVFPSSSNISLTNAFFQYFEATPIIEYQGYRFKLDLLTVAEVELFYKKKFALNTTPRGIIAPCIFSPTTFLIKKSPECANGRARYLHTVTPDVDYNSTATYVAYPTYCLRPVE